LWIDGCSQIFLSGVGFWSDAYDLFIINIGERVPLRRRRGCKCDACRRSRGMAC